MTGLLGPPPALTDEQRDELVAAARALSRPYVADKNAPGVLCACPLCRLAVAGNRQFNRFKRLIAKVVPLRAVGGAERAIEHAGQTQHDLLQRLQALFNTQFRFHREASPFLAEREASHARAWGFKP